MSAKAIYEAKGKSLLNNCLNGAAEQNLCASVDANTDWTALPALHPWLNSTVSTQQQPPHTLMYYE